MPDNAHYKKAYDEARQHLDGNIKALRAQLRSAENLQTLQKLEAQMNQWHEVNMKLVAQGDGAALESLNRQASELFGNAGKEMTALHKNINLNSQTAIDTAVWTGNLLLSVLAAAIIAVLFLVSRSISHTVGAGLTLVERIAGTRDLSLRANTEGKDEISRLLGGVNTLMDSFKQLLSEAKKNLQRKRLHCPRAFRHQL